jgi:peptide/nickel transport system substrate-binding protein
MKSFRHFFTTSWYGRLCCPARHVAHGCAREPRTPNTLRISGPDPSTLDPAKAFDTTSINFVRVLYRGLVDYGEGAEIVPAVAQKYSISPDGKNLSFQAASRRLFSFGTPR